MAEKIELPLNDYEIDFQQYDKVEIVLKGYENTKGKYKVNIKTAFKPINSVKIKITDYNPDGTVYASWEDGYGRGWGIIREWIEMVENGVVIGTVKIFAYPKKSLKGIKTAVCGRKGECKNIIHQLENSVRKMF